VLDPRVKTLPCTDEPPLDLPVLLAPNVEALALPNTLSQQLSTSVLEGLLPDIAVTHLMNLLFKPELVLLLLLLPVVDVSFLVLLVPVGSEPLFAANAEVTILLLDAAIKDTAVTIAIIANDVVITFFIYRANDVLFIKNRLLNKVSRTNVEYVLSINIKSNT
jgi:hypothetical protein